MQWMTISRLNGLFFCLIGTSACTVLNAHFSSARFESPEVSGHLKPRIGVGLSRNHEITVATDASIRPPEINTPTDEKSLDIPMIAGLGLGRNFEVGVRYAFPYSAALLSGKFQILGHTAHESAPGDFALAVAAGFGTQNSAIGGDQNGILGPAGFNWHASETTNVQDYALLFGYRINDGLLIYGGPYFTKFVMSGTVHDDLSDDGTSPAADYHIDQQGQSAGLNTDFEFTFSEAKLFSLTAELNYGTFQWTNIAALTDLRAGLLCEWTF